MFGNLGMSVATTHVAVTAWLYRTVMSPGFGAILNPVQSLMQKAWGERLFIPLIGIAVGLTGLYFVLRARRGNLAEAGTQSAKTGLIVLVAAAAVIYPLLIGPAIDKALTGGIGTVNELASGVESRDTPDLIAANLHEAALYNQWLSSTFGTSDGALNQKVAAEYGPRLFNDSALTRAEARQIEQDPSKAEDIVNGKVDDYVDAANEIKDKYPTVYAYVAGNHGDTAFGAGITAWFAAAVGTAFLIYALTKLALAMVIIRLAVALFPGLALLAQHPKGHKYGMKVLNYSWTAIVTAFFYGAAAVTFVVIAIRNVLDPMSTLNMWARLAVLALLTLGMFVVAHKIGLADEMRKARALWDGKKRRVVATEIAPEVQPQTADDMLRPQPAVASAPTSPPAESFMSTARPQPEGPAGGGAAGLTRTVFTPKTAPIDIGDVTATPTTPAAKGAIMQGAAQGAAANAAGVVAVTAITGGTATGPMIAAAAAKGAAAGGATTAISRTRGPAKAVDPSEVWSPEKGSPAPGPSTARSTISDGQRVYNIYTPTTSGAAK
jgi:hypothetical protein